MSDSLIYGELRQLGPMPRALLQIDATAGVVDA